jgi:hypothetical protein
VSFCSIIANGNVAVSSMHNPIQAQLVLCFSITAVIHLLFNWKLPVISMLKKAVRSVRSFANADFRSKLYPHEVDFDAVNIRMDGVRHQIQTLECQKLPLKSPRSLQDKLPKPSPRTMCAKVPQQSPRSHTLQPEVSSCGIASQEGGSDVKLGCIYESTDYYRVIEIEHDDDIMQLDMSSCSQNPQRKQQHQVQAGEPIEYNMERGDNNSSNSYHLGTLRSNINELVYSIFGGNRIDGDTIVDSQTC